MLSQYDKEDIQVLGFYRVLKTFDEMDIKIVHKTDKKYNDYIIKHKYVNYIRVTRWMEQLFYREQ